MEPSSVYTVVFSLAHHEVACERLVLTLALAEEFSVAFARFVCAMRYLEFNGLDLSRFPILRVRAMKDSGWLVNLARDVLL
jgi:hypothetical protein